MNLLLAVVLMGVGQTYALIDDPLPSPVLAEVVYSGSDGYTTERVVNGITRYDGTAPTRLAGGRTWLWCPVHQQWNGFRMTSFGWKKEMIANASTGWMTVGFTAPVYNYAAPSYTTQTYRGLLGASYIRTTQNYQGRYGATWSNIAPIQRAYGGNNYYSTGGAYARPACANCRR